MEKRSYIARPKGRNAHANFFAVPNENPAAGAVTGTKVLREILDAMRTEGSRNAGCFPQVMRDLAVAINEKGSKSRSGAATAIVWLLADCLLFVANSRHDEWIASKLKEAEATNAWWAGYEAEEKAVFVARMKAGRDAAKLKRACVDPALTAEA